MERVGQDYVEQLMWGGFSTGWIKRVLYSAITGYSRMVDLEIKGKLE